MQALLTGWLILINLAGLAAMSADKKRARRNQWRIPERTLFGIAILGGSLGCMIGMHHFHHKTRHNSFRYGLPMILFLQLGAVLILCRL